MKKSVMKNDSVKHLTEVEPLNKVHERFISVEDLITIKTIKTKVGHMAQKAEKAILESQFTELEHQNVVLNVYLKYNLNMQDSIDETTGKIMPFNNETSQQESK